MSPEIETRKNRFLQTLDDTRARSEAALNGIDPELVIYPEAGWRVKDLIAHVAAWENEVANSIEAFNDEHEYSIPGFTTDDAHNEQIFRQYRDMAIEEIEATWADARKRFKLAIRAIPTESFDGQIMCPWKKYSGIDGIVRDMVNHENEHLHDILAKVD